MSGWSYAIVAYVGAAALYGGYLAALLRQRRRLHRLTGPARAEGATPHATRT
jgi:hypothetical protein